LKLRIPHGRLDQPLDARSIWQLPNTLDGEERLIARQIFIECHRTGSRRVGDVIDLLELLHPVERKTLVGAIRRKLGLAPEPPPARSGSGWSPWQLCPICGCQPLDEMTGSARPVSVRRWHCAAHAGQAAPEDMEPVGSGVRLSPSGVLVEYNAGEIERERAEAELREARYQEQLAVRKFEAEARQRRLRGSWARSTSPSRCPQGLCTAGRRLRLAGGRRADAPRAWTPRPYGQVPNL
jgi:hypothetical protein